MKEVYNKAKALIEEAAFNTEVEFLGYFPFQIIGTDIAFLQCLNLRRAERYIVKALHNGKIRETLACNLVISYGSVRGTQLQEVHKRQGLAYKFVVGRYPAYGH